MRDNSPPEAVSAAGANGSPGFGRIRNAASSAPEAAGLPLTELHPKLPLSQPDAAELLGDGRRERPGGGLACGAQLRRQGVDPRPASARARAAAARGSAPPATSSSSARLGCPRQQLVIARTAEAALCRRQFAPARTRSARDDPARPPTRQGRLAAPTPSRGVEARRREARCRRARARERAARAVRVRVRRRDEAGCSFAFLGGERLAGCGDSLRELGDVPKPLSLGAQRLLCAGLESLGVVGKGSKLGQTRLARCCSLLELLVPAPCRRQLAPGQAQLGAATLLIARRRKHRGRRAGTRGERAGAARIAPTSRSAVRRSG